MEITSWEKSRQISGVSVMDLTRKINHLSLPVFNFIQAADPWQDLERTGEQGGGSDKFSAGVSGAGEKNPRLYCR